MIQAAKQVKSGKAILVDVRDPVSFEKEHAEVSVSNDPASFFSSADVCEWDST